MSEKVCLVTGVGPGTGSALVREFAAGGYRVAMLARNEERLLTLEREIAEASSYVCDVTDSAALTEVHSRIKTDLGPPQIVVHNAVGAERGTYMEISPERFVKNFEVNTVALLQWQKPDSLLFVMPDGITLISSRQPETSMSISIQIVQVITIRL